MKTTLYIKRTKTYKLFALSTLLFITLNSASAHQGGIGNEAMWKACENKKVNDQCSFQNKSHDIYRGTCQSMANHMACVRNQPIEHSLTVHHEHTYQEKTKR